MNILISVAVVILQLEVRFLLQFCMFSPFNCYFKSSAVLSSLQLNSWLELLVSL